MNSFFVDMIAHGALTLVLLLVLAVLCLLLLGAMIALHWAFRASASYIRRWNMDAADEREAIREWKAKHREKARAALKRSFSAHGLDASTMWSDEAAGFDETREEKSSKDESSYAYERIRRPARPRMPEQPRQPDQPL